MTTVCIEGMMIRSNLLSGVELHITAVHVRGVSVCPTPRTAAGYLQRTAFRQREREV